LIDQESTHGTFINNQKIAALLPTHVYSGDIITLGCTLESTNATTMNHLPTELEIGIVPMHDTQVETHHISLPSFASNSFHAPDTESEADEDQPTRPSTWKPFARTATEARDTEIGIPLTTNPPVVDLVRDVSSRTSAIGEENAKKVQVDLTVENPWVVAEPVSFEFEDGRHKHGSHNLFNNSIHVDEEEDGYHYEDYVGFQSDDNDSDNGETQVPETQAYQQMAFSGMLNDADVNVCLFNMWLMIDI
jgi:hypothetical protein